MYTHTQDSVYCYEYAVKYVSTAAFARTRIRRTLYIYIYVQIYIYICIVQNFSYMFAAYLRKNLFTAGVGGRVTSSLGEESRSSGVK